MALLLTLHLPRGIYYTHVLHPQSRCSVFACRLSKHLLSKKALNHRIRVVLTFIITILVHLRGPNRVPQASGRAFIPQSRFANAEIHYSNTWHYWTIGFATVVCAYLLYAYVGLSLNSAFWNRTHPPSYPKSTRYEWNFNGGGILPSPTLF